MEPDLDLILSEHLKKQHNPKQVDVNICIRCKSVNSIIVDTSKGVVVCDNCGLETRSSTLSQGPEWRYYGTGTNPTRCNYVNPLLPISSFHTCITSNTKLPQWTRQIQWNSMPHNERSLWQTFCKIDKVKCVPGSVTAKAKFYIKIVLENKLSRGSAKEGLIGAALYFACKQDNVVILIKDLAIDLDISPKKLSKGITEFTKIIFNLDNTSDYICSTTPADYVLSFGEKLKIPYNMVIEIVKVTKDVELIGCIQNNTSISVAASCINFMIQEKKIEGITKQHIKDITSVSIITLNNTYKILKMYRKLIFDL